ncbi:MAG: hypothetical protein Q8M94_21655 [Ignavibacteria bacterium]|nr:hypothetical protein [Ignavibacteria bacterium]
MSQAFEVKIDEGQMADVRRMLADTKIMPGKVISRAINKTLSGVKTDASTEIRNVINATKKAVDANMSKTNATIAKPSGFMTVKGKVLELGSFSPRQTNVGVTVTIYKAKGAQKFVSAFVATMPSGHKSVYRREYKGTPVGKPVRRPWKKFGEKYRLPIRPLYGPNLATIMESYPVMTPVMAKAGDRIQTNLEHELDFEMSKL